MSRRVCSPVGSQRHRVMMILRKSRRRSRPAVGCPSTLLRPALWRAPCICGVVNATPSAVSLRPAALIAFAVIGVCGEEESFEAAHSIAARAHVETRSRVEPTSWL